MHEEYFFLIGAKIRAANLRNNSKKKKWLYSITSHFVQGHFVQPCFLTLVMSRAKRWCFTLNNYASLLDPALWEKVSYLVYQEEIGESGTTHLQGYIEFSDPRTLATVRALDGLAGAHFEVAKGSPEQNQNYCRKEEGRIGGPYEFGELSKGQGARNDLVVVRDAIRRGATVGDLYEEHFAPFVRYERAFLNFKRFCQVPRNFKTFVILLVGTPGTGKTRFAYKLMDYLGPSRFIVASPKGSGLYFDQYMGETSCLIDEMDGHVMTPTFFNGLCDRYPFTVPVHGTAGLQFVSQFLILTTNYHPKFWWKRGVNLEALYRRIDLMIKFIPPKPRVSRPSVIYVNGQFVHQ